MEKSGSRNSKAGESTLKLLRPATRHLREEASLEQDSARLGSIASKLKFLAAETDKGLPRTNSNASNKLNMTEQGSTRKSKVDKGSQKSSTRKGEELNLDLDYFKVNQKINSTDQHTPGMVKSNSLMFRKQLQGILSRNSVKHRDPPGPKHIQIADTPQNKQPSESRSSRYQVHKDHAALESSAAKKVKKLTINYRDTEEAIKQLERKAGKSRLIGADSDMSSRVIQLISNIHKSDLSYKASNAGLKQPQNQKGQTFTDKLRQQLLKTKSQANWNKQLNNTTMGPTALNASQMTSIFSNKEALSKNLMTALQLAQKTPVKGFTAVNLGRVMSRSRSKSAHKTTTKEKSIEKEKNTPKPKLGNNKSPISSATKNPVIADHKGKLSMGILKQAKFADPRNSTDISNAPTQSKGFSIKPELAKFSETPEMPSGKKEVVTQKVFKNFFDSLRVNLKEKSNPVNMKLPGTKRIEAFESPSIPAAHIRLDLGESSPSMYLSRFVVNPGYQVPFTPAMEAEKRAIGNADYLLKQFDQKGRQRFHNDKGNLSAMEGSKNDSSDDSGILTPREEVKGSVLKAGLNKSFDFDSSPVLDTARGQRGAKQGFELEHTIKKITSSPIHMSIRRDLEQTIVDSHNDPIETEAAEKALQIFSELKKQNPRVESITNSIKAFFGRQPSLLGQDYQTTLSNYELMRCIGKGSFGKVHLATQVLTGLEVAIKAVNKKSLVFEEGERQKIENEIQLLTKTAEVKNIVRLLEVFETKDYYFFVMEYAGAGDLLGYLRKKGLMTEDQAKSIIMDIVAALEGLHDLRIIHRDIKLDNVLVSGKGRALLGDLGISKQLEKDEILKDQCGTPAYLAPEVLEAKGYRGFEADIWALGVLLHTLLLGRVPFKADTIEELYPKILESPFVMPERPATSEELKDLLSRMLVKNPDERISLADIKKHAWFGGTTLHRTFVHSSQDKESMEAAARHLTRVFGFPMRYLQDSLNAKLMNHPTACYKNLIANFSSQV